MRILIVEDNEERIRTFLEYIPQHIHVVVTRDAGSALLLLEHADFDLLFLDHDLGGEVFVDEREFNTGSTIASWICDYSKEINLKRIIIHSLNVPAGFRMAQRIKCGDHPIEVWQAPFTTIDWDILDQAWHFD